MLPGTAPRAIAASSSATRLPVGGHRALVVAAIPDRVPAARVSAARARRIIGSSAAVLPPAPARPASAAPRSPPDSRHPAVRRDHRRSSALRGFPAAAPRPAAPGSNRRLRRGPHRPLPARCFLHQLGRHTRMSSRACATRARPPVACLPAAAEPARCSRAPAPAGPDWRPAGYALHLGQPQQALRRLDPHLRPGPPRAGQPGSEERLGAVSATSRRSPSDPGCRLQLVIEGVEQIARCSPRSSNRAPASAFSRSAETNPAPAVPASSASAPPAPWPSTAAAPAAARGSASRAPAPPAGSARRGAPDRQAGRAPRHSARPPPARRPWPDRAKIGIGIRASDPHQQPPQRKRIIRHRRQPARQPRGARQTRWSPRPKAAAHRHHPPAAARSRNRAAAPAPRGRPGCCWA